MPTLTSSLTVSFQLTWTDGAPVRSFLAAWLEEAGCGCFPAFTSGDQEVYSNVDLPSLLVTLPTSLSISPGPAYQGATTFSPAPAPSAFTRTDGFYGPGPFLSAPGACIARTDSSGQVTNTNTYAFAYPDDSAATAQLQANAAASGGRDEFWTLDSSGTAIFIPASAVMVTLTPVFRLGARAVLLGVNYLPIGASSGSNYQYYGIGGIQFAGAPGSGPQFPPFLPYSQGIDGTGGSGTALSYAASFQSAGLTTNVPSIKAREPNLTVNGAAWPTEQTVWISNTLADGSGALPAYPIGAAGAGPAGYPWGLPVAPNGNFAGFYYDGSGNINGGPAAQVVTSDAENDGTALALPLFAKSGWLPRRVRLTGEIYPTLPVWTGPDATGPGGAAAYQPFSASARLGSSTLSLPSSMLLPGESDPYWLLSGVDLLLNDNGNPASAQSPLPGSGYLFLFVPYADIGDVAGSDKDGLYLLGRDGGVGAANFDAPSYVDGGAWECVAVSGGGRYLPTAAPSGDPAGEIYFDTPDLDTAATHGITVLYGPAGLYRLQTPPYNLLPSFAGVTVDCWVTQGYSDGSQPPTVYVTDFAGQVTDYGLGSSAFPNATPPQACLPFRRRGGRVSYYDPNFQQQITLDTLGNSTFTQQIVNPDGSTKTQSISLVWSDYHDGFTCWLTYSEATTAPPGPPGGGYSGYGGRGIRVDAALPAGGGQPYFAIAASPSTLSYDSSGNPTWTPGPVRVSVSLDGGASFTPGTDTGASGTAKAYPVLLDNLAFLPHGRIAFTGSGAPAGGGAGVTFAKLTDDASGRSGWRNPAVSEAAATWWRTQSDGHKGTGSKAAPASTLYAWTGSSSGGRTVVSGATSEDAETWTTDANLALFPDTQTIPAGTVSDVRGLLVAKNALSTNGFYGASGTSAFGGANETPLQSLDGEALVLISHQNGGLVLAVWRSSDPAEIGAFSQMVDSAGNPFTVYNVQQTQFDGPNSGFVGGASWNGRIVIVAQDDHQTISVYVSEDGGAHFARTLTSRDGLKTWQAGSITGP